MAACHSRKHPKFIKQRFKLLKCVLCLWASPESKPERTCLALHAFMPLGLGVMYNYAISPPLHFSCQEIGADSIVMAVLLLGQWAFNGDKPIKVKGVSWKT